jgi:hypothetical protein
LHRLVDVTVKGVAEHALFEKRVGVPQDKAPWAGIVWMHLYAAHFPDRTPVIPRAEIKSGHRWLGGDVMVLDGVLATMKPGMVKG